MSPVESDLERLSQAVLSEARTEAEQTMSEARAKADAIRRQAKDEAAAQQKAILERATQEAERIRRQAQATAEIQARMLRLERREKLLQSVFETACRQLPTVQQWKDYDQIAFRLLREALVHLGASTAQVSADAATNRLLTEAALEAIARELKVKLQLKEPLAGGTGVIVQTEDGRMHYDNTLGTRLDRIQNTLRTAVYHILMGEAL